jgi:hypothetical protein
MKCLTLIKHIFNLFRAIKMSAVSLFDVIPDNVPVIDRYTDGNYS